jgi:hypothetical protein
LAIETRTRAEGGKAYNLRAKKEKKLRFHQRKEHKAI